MIICSRYGKFDALILSVLILSANSPLHFVMNTFKSKFYNEACR